MGEPNAILDTFNRLTKQAMVDGALDPQFKAAKQRMLEGFEKAKESGEHANDLDALASFLFIELATLHLSASVFNAMTKSILGRLFDALPEASQLQLADDLKTLKLKDILPPA